VTVCIIKPCKVRHDATVLELAAGDFLTVAPGKETRLIETGHARSAIPQDYRSMAEDFHSRDPCKDCWRWNQQNRHDLWREHIRALQNSDISKARLTFNQMTAAWSVAQPTI
jgi:hypothetical protein